MTVKLLLDRKREGFELDADDIRNLVEAYTRGEVPDYQMSAFAMAVCCKGMTDRETLALTESMRDSGACLEWDMLSVPTADKHSTGGVGDKISLVAQPLAASCGVAVPSLTGRGLGLTGGTADKMESIPGYVAGLSLNAYRDVVAACGCSLAMQTQEIAPADRKLYALRDVTGTVPSVPLIVASILSKKLAEGAGTLVFDVKCGCGAFMQTRDDALTLARALVAGAKGAGRKSCALVTDMDEPLGFAVGNALEVKEAIDILKGEASVPDVENLSVELAARMVSMAREMPLDAARSMCSESLAGRKAWERFARMVELHGGDLDAFGKLCAGMTPAGEVLAEADGFVGRVDASAVARAAFALGAGRAAAGDAIDPIAGVRLLVASGDHVEKGQPVAMMHASDRRESLPVAVDMVRSAVEIVPDAPVRRRLVLEIVE